MRSALIARHEPFCLDRIVLTAPAPVVTAKLDPGLLRRLAEMRGDQQRPIISAYIDMTPDPSRPAERPGLVVLRDGLRAITRQYPLCGDLAERALAWLENDCPRDAAGAVLFAACAPDERGDELFFAAPTPVSFDH